MLSLSVPQQAILSSNHTLVDDTLLSEINRSISDKNADLMTLESLEAAVDALNALYRAGLEGVSDADYDFIFLVGLQKIDPNNERLHTVETEPEEAFEGKTVKLSQRMLSTDKAYDEKAIKAWYKRIDQAAKEQGMSVDNLIIEVTPKLDGFAALDNGKTLCTRGNGYQGTDISRVFDRGLSIAGNGVRGQGPGEIVIHSEYFDQHLINEFENTRNFQGSIIKEHELSFPAKKAIEAKAAVFFPFSQLPRWTGSLKDLNKGFDSIVDQVWVSVPYDVDGVVIEAPALREAMGHTSKHHRNTIAFKRNEAPTQVEVTGITFQTGKTGRITPVAELVPTLISGAILSRATLHNMGWAEKKGVGTGALVDVVRSGLVIPKIVSVQRPAHIESPGCCDSCDSPITRDEDNLYCSNEIDCPAQVESVMQYFFDTLGHVDGFGEKTIEKLNENGCSSLQAIYSLDQAQLLKMGFGLKTANNLLDELERSRATPIEDWRFLASFSLHNVGRGGCERILKVYPLEDIFKLDLNDLMKIDGFAEKKSLAFLVAAKKIKETFSFLSKLGFNLERTELAVNKVSTGNPIEGKTIVFTGSMVHGKRDDMKKEAKQLGAIVGSSVSSKTDYLVIGEKVGQSKIDKAEKHGTVIITESDYIDMISGNEPDNGMGR